MYAMHAKNLMLKELMLVVIYPTFQLCELVMRETKLFETLNHLLCDVQNDSLFQHAGQNGVN